MIVGALLLGASPARADRYLHEVLPGETLRELAQRYKISAGKIRKLNALHDDKLVTGQKLQIVTLQPVQIRRKVSYRVRRGDTLTGIAKQYRMPLMEIVRLNAEASRRTLRTGERVWVVVAVRHPQPRVHGLALLADGPGYTVRDADRAWGTPLALANIREAFASYQRQYPNDPALRVHDLSRQHGGFLAPHVSHQRGEDVDVPLPLKPPARRAKGKRAAQPEIDLARTWALFKSFLETDNVIYMFTDYRVQRQLFAYALTRGDSEEWLRQVFQYPQGRSRPVGIIRHDPGHTAHVHIRFRSDTPEDDPFTTGIAAR